MTSKLEYSNYLPMKQFEAFVLAIPELKQFKNLHQKPPMRAMGFQILYMLTYYCALRISEALAVKVEDLNLERGILTIRNAKTSKTKCKCARWDYKDTHSRQRNVLVSANKKCKKCHGTGYYYRDQFTTIPWIIKTLLKRWANEVGSGLLFNTTRQTAWVYGKAAAEKAKLDLFEQQRERTIEGYWNHLLRKSYEKQMGNLGASRALRMLKLRHADKDAHDTYEKVDLPALIKWENKHIK